MLRRDEFDPPQTLNLVRRAQMAGSGWEESPLPQPRGVSPPSDLWVPKFTRRILEFPNFPHGF